MYFWYLMYRTAGRQSKQTHHSMYLTFDMACLPSISFWLKQWVHQYAPYILASKDLSFFPIRSACETNQIMGERRGLSSPFSGTGPKASPLGQDKNRQAVHSVASVPKFEGMGGKRGFKQRNVVAQEQI